MLINRKKKHSGVLAQSDKVGKNVRRHIIIKLLQPVVVKVTVQGNATPVDPGSLQCLVK